MTVPFLTIDDFIALLKDNGWNVASNDFYDDYERIIIEKDGKKVKMQEGKIIFIFDGILETDYEHRWESKPIFYVMRTVFEKYVYTPFISGFERGVKEDLMGLKNNVKAFLNLTKYA